MAEVVAKGEGKPHAPSSPDTPSSTAVAQAVQLVHDLLEQITANDAPAVNEVVDEVVRSRKSSRVGSPSWSAAGGGSTTLLSDMAGASSFESDITDLYTTNLIVSGSKEDGVDYSIQDSYSMLKMGHCAFAALCVSTLQNVQGAIPVDAAAPEEAIPLQIQTPSNVADVSNKSCTSFLNVKGRRRKKFSLLWSNRNRCGPAQSEEEKKDEEAPRRLQMFGSEYARHLSTSQLAPPPPPLPSKHKSRRSNTTRQRSVLLDEAAPEIQTGALLDICVTVNDEPPPTGYYRISKTATGKPATFSKMMHLNVKKEAVWDKAAQRPCVTAITLIYPDRQEFVPPGFCIVRMNKTKGDGPPANLNPVGQERVYLCLRRSREGNPVTGIVPLVPAAAEAIPTGYTVVERTPRNFVASLTGSTGEPMFLAYRQRLANLETLRPVPLVLSVIKKQQRKHHPYAEAATEKKSNRRVSLSAYYCTGGTVVESDIGRFHIMDRTTHSLLSPSSVANRLNLIEMSRRRSADEEPAKYSYSTAYARSDMDIDCESVGDASHASVSSLGTGYLRREGGGRSLLDFPIHEKSRVNADMASECSTTLKDEYHLPAAEKIANLSSLLTPALDDTLDLVTTGENAERRSCREAMSFIPEIETATNHAYEQYRMRFEARTALITPILTACYIRHGGAALLAVDGLTSLLTDTDFFRDDVDLSDDSDNGSSARITILDLAIQAVCDVATSGSQEIAFASCVDFVERSVAYSQGQLNTRTIGFVVRFYLFVFYFDASIPRKKSSKWPSPAWRPPSMPDEEDFPMLYDPRGDAVSGLCCYLPGGAPQAAALALKELLSLSIVRLGKISVTEFLILEQNSSDRQSSLSEGSAVLKDAYAPLLDSVLSSLIDKAVDHVDRANYTQLALHQIHRSGGSELFWHDMVYACGCELFAKDEKLGIAGKDIYIMVFAMLQQLVKVSSGKLRAIAQNAELLPKDIASKLLSLELLLHFLEFWSDEQEAVNGMNTVNGTDTVRSIDTLAFAVRRTVVPCLLWNTRSGLENPQVFRRVIRIVSELWCSPVYRKHCKVELGILFEHFALKMLELGPQWSFDLRGDQGQISLLSQQIELIGEIKNWFSSDPKDVIELYLNYDTDVTSEITGPNQIMPGTRWQIFQRLCAGLSSIAEQCGELIGNQIRQNQSIILTQADKSTGAKSDVFSFRDDAKRDAAKKAKMREAARVLRKTSLVAIAQIVKDLAISAGAASGQDFTAILLSWSPSESTSPYESSLSHSSLNGALMSPDGTVPRAKANPKKSSAREGDDGVLKFWRHVIVEDLKQRSAASVPSAKESLETAFGIARQKSLKKAVEYLIACNTLTPAPRDIANFLRIHKDRFDPAALGLYLSESGTGGAETEYWNSIRTLFVRAISFIGMNVEDGLRHFLTTSGFRLPGEAQRIDRVMNTFAQCYFEDNAGDNQHCPFKDQDTVYLLVFAIIMLNTDLHKSDSTSRKSQKKMTKAEFINNLRGATQSEGVSKDYLSAIYDSIEACPIAMHEDIDATTAQESRNQSLNEILTNARASDSLLRGLAVHDFKFATIDDFTDSLEYSRQDALSDLTCSCVSKTWHQWHGVINSCLETAHLDPQGMGPAVDILLYALAVTVCLNMPMERSAFLGQLVRLRAFEERRQGRWVSAPDNSHREEKWYLELEEACSGLDERKLWALQKIHGWVLSLKTALRVDVQSKVEMTEAVAELIDGDFLLHDPARAFLQSGNLIKKSGRTGRSTMYRFYLFSDVLLYASKEADGRYKIHEELPLHLMKIVDWFPPSQKNRKILFEVHHPRKSFQVLCLSNDARKSWVENIRASILVEMERKMTVEAVRLSVSTANKK